MSLAMGIKIIICVAFLFSGCASQKINTKPNRVLSNPYLFKATKDKKTIYILGTIHDGVSLEEFSPQIKMLIKKSNVVLHEVNYELISARDDHKEGLHKALYKKDDELSVSMQLTAEEFNVLVEKVNRCEKLKGFDTSVLSAMGFLTVLLTCSDFKNETKKSLSDDNKTDAKLDEDIVNFARKNSITTNNLDLNIEKVSFCLYSGGDYIAHLKKFLTDDENFFEELNKSSLKNSENILQAYLSSDTKVLTEQLNTLSPQHMKCLFTERHDSWMNTIAAELTGVDQIFISVGALHVLNTTDNLLNRLKERGFKTSRIQFRGDNRPLK